MVFLYFLNKQKAFAVALLSLLFIYINIFIVSNIVKGINVTLEDVNINTRSVQKVSKFLKITRRVYATLIQHGSQS